MSAFIIIFYCFCECQHILGMESFSWLGGDQSHPDKGTSEAKPGSPSPPWKHGLTVTENTLSNKEEL